MRALVTRPRQDAAAVTRALAGHGIDAMAEPLLDIATETGVTLPLAGIQGFLATSANGVRALAANLPAADAAWRLPLWAVGDATARAAAGLGFAHVTSAGGTVEDLARLVAAAADPLAGPLLHAAGSAVAGDLAALLAPGGFTVRRIVLYRAQPASSFSPALLAALDDQSLDLALFFSPRTAKTFVTLARAAGRSDACRHVAAYALSPAVARELTGLPWRRVAVAARPEQEALLAAILDDAQPAQGKGTD